MSWSTLPFWFCAVFALALSGCGEKTPEQLLERAAKETERYTRGATMARGEYIETLEDFYLEKPTVVASDLETHIRFRKWVCNADGGRKSCKGEGAVPIDYLIRSAVVDPTSIGVERAGDGESGFALRFGCSSLSSQHCIIFQRIGGVGIDYDRCEKRDCSSSEAQWEAHVKELAQVRENKGVEWIACGNEKTCEETAIAFRETIARASGRPFITNAKTFAKTISYIDTSLKGAVFREKFDEARSLPVGSSTVKGADIGYKTQTVRIDDDGRLHFDIRFCAYDSDNGCDDDADWLAEIVHVRFDEVDATAVRIEDHSQPDHPDRAGPERKGFLVGAACMAREHCVDSARSNRRGPFLSMPCPDRETCKSIERQFEAMATFAASPDGREMAALAEAKDTAATSIKDFSHARRVAKKIASRLTKKETMEVTDYLFSYYKLDVRTTDVEDFLFLVIRGKGRDCLEEDCKGTADKELEALISQTRVDLQQVDVASIRRSEETTKTGEQHVYAECEDKQVCVEHHLGGLLTTPDIIVDLKCANAKQCKSLAEDLRGLVTFAQMQTPTGKVDAQHALAKFDGIISDLKNHVQGAQYAAYDETNNDTAVFRTDYVRVDVDGRLHIGILGCFGKQRVDCNADSEWLHSVSIVSPKDLDRSKINVEAFDESGKPLSAFFELRWKNFAEKGKGFTIQAACIDEENCIDHDDGLGKSAALFIPCSGEKSCKGVISALSSISRFAPTPDFTAALKAHRDRLNNGTTIKNKRKARQAASRISKTLTNRNFRLIDGEHQSFNLTQNRLRYDNEAAIIIETSVEKVITGQGQTADASDGQTRIDLAQLDYKKIHVRDPDDETGWFLQISCVDDAECVSSTFYGEKMYSPRWTITCRNLEHCENAARDLRGIVHFVGGSPAANTVDEDRAEPPVPTSDRQDKQSSIADSQAPRKFRRHLSALNDATRNAAIYIRAAEGPSLRKLQALQSSIDNDGQMTAHRRVCLALLAEDMGQQNECRLDTLFHPYDLKITLGALDAKTVMVSSSVAGAIGKSWWINVSCRKRDISCARLIVPTTPTHLRLQSETMMRSFLESETDPKIRIPCVNKKVCEKGARALRDLINAAPKPKRDQQKTQRGGDIVGVWSFQSAYPTGWVIEFEANGSYTFTMPNARIDGAYSAKNGHYDLKARQPNSDDTGTYRLLDEDTLELAGRLGVGVWRRVEEE